MRRSIVATACAALVACLLMSVGCARNPQEPASAGPVLVDVTADKSSVVLAKGADLAATIAAVPCDAVVIATPIDLSRLIEIPQTAVRVTYGVVDRGDPTVRTLVEDFLRDRGLIS